MRGLVYILALLAAVKVGFQEFHYRNAAESAVVQAYREVAVKACREHARVQNPGEASPWEQDAQIKLLVGKNNLDVYFWQVDNALWNARYKNPYLLISAAEHPRLFCEYDIVHGAASLYRM